MEDANELRRQNRQKVFDVVSAHLLKQNQKSRNDKTCMYHSPGGLRCAVGCLISDENYSATFEGRGAAHSTVLEAVEASGYLVDTENGVGTMFLCRLQEIHDASSPEMWQRNLTRTAEFYGLEFRQ